MESNDKASSKWMGIKYMKKSQRLPKKYFKDDDLHDFNQFNATFALLDPVFHFHTMCAFHLMKALFL